MANQITPAQIFNKYEVQIMIQEYVPSYGWADAGAAVDMKDAKRLIKEYNAEGIQAKSVRRWVLNKDAFLCQALLNFCRDYYRRNGQIWPNEVDVLKSNGVKKFTLTFKEICEVLGDDCRLVEA